MALIKDYILFAGLYGRNLDQFRSPNCHHLNAIKYLLISKLIFTYLYNIFRLNLIHLDEKYQTRQVLVCRVGTGVSTIWIAYELAACLYTSIY